MAETCWVCADQSEGSPRMVSKSDDAPLCNKHWNLWLARYLWPSEHEPPCSAHVIEEPHTSKTGDTNGNP